MSLLNTTTINLQIEAFTTRQSRNGLTPQATRELQQLQEIAAFLPVASRAIKQAVGPRFRDEVESLVIGKYLELRNAGTLTEVPPARYIRRMVQTAVANMHRQDCRSAGILGDDQVRYPMTTDTTISPVAMVSDNVVTGYEYADTRHTSEAVDSWMDNYDLVSAYFTALANEIDKLVLWAIWVYKTTPRELASQLGCNITLVYAAIRRIRAHSYARTAALHASSSP